MDPARYSATETLRNGAVVHIRALRPDDRAEMLAAVGWLGKEALYRRFLAPKRHFSEREIDFFLNVDFKNHVALVALLAEGGRPMIVGGARYIVSRPGRAKWPSPSTTRIRSWAFVAEVLPENVPMLKVFERCGLSMTTRSERGSVHVTLGLVDIGAV